MKVLDLNKPVRFSMSLARMASFFDGKIPHEFLAACEVEDSETASEKIASQKTASEKAAPKEYDHTGETLFLSPNPEGGFFLKTPGYNHGFVAPIPYLEKPSGRRKWLYRNNQMEIPKEDLEVLLKHLHSRYKNAVLKMGNQAIVLGHGE